MTVVLAICVAASPGKQNKEPVQDCVLLRCCLLRFCFAWQAKQGARARLRSAALLPCLASKTRSPCKTALLRQGARARLRSAALLRCLASAKKRPCKTALVRCCLLHCCFAWQATKRPCKTAFCCVAALPGKRKKAPTSVVPVDDPVDLRWTPVCSSVVQVFSGQRSATVFSLRKSWPSRGIATAVCNSEQPGHWLLAPGHHGRCHTLT